MLSESTWRERKAIADAERLTSDERFIDFGVRLYTVAQDPNGIEVYRDRPRVRVIDYQTFGGVLDTRTYQYAGPSKNPVVLYGSKEQVPLVRHGNELPSRVLVYSAEGAGKTRGVLAPWMLMRALEFTGQHVEILGTAPTHKRLARLITSLKEIMPPEWYEYRATDALFVLRNGVTLRLLSTKQYSHEVGSPIQGFDAAAAGSDELQDHSHNANDDIEARGRRAPGGVFRRMCTATAKDSPDWRLMRDRIQASELWGIARIPGRANPFVSYEHWDNLRTLLDARSYARRVEALDVRPERATYAPFERSRHVMPIPQVGARDVTRNVLGRFMSDGRFDVVIGHDPGNLKQVSVLCKAYELKRGEPHVWFVVRDFTTYGTTEDHAVQLVNLLRREYGLNKLAPKLGRGPRQIDRLSPQAHVRIDPYGRSAAKPDVSVHVQFRNVGLHARSAAYDKGKGSGVIDREARIEMINRLLLSASGRTRLYFSCDENGRPHAKDTVDAIEMSSRDDAGRAEAQKKDNRDVSHWPCSLAYALWKFERLRASDETYRRAES